MKNALNELLFWLTLIFIVTFICALVWCIGYGLHWILWALMHVLGPNA